MTQTADTIGNAQRNLPNTAVPPLSRLFCFELPAQPRSGEQALLGTRFQRPELQMSDSMKTAYGRDI
ncbi:MAG: hypothetical protein IPO40_23480 [Fibrobacteres bacterium]|nr:hypothetical protein [Fibrobacterota bacterium]